MFSFIIIIYYYYLLYMALIKRNADNKIWLRTRMKIRTVNGVKGGVGGDAFPQTVQ